MGGRLIETINGGMSLGQRLVLLTVLFAVPIILLQAAFVTNSVRDIAFLDRELQGLTYLSQVWPDFAATARGGGTVDAPDDVARREVAVRLGSGAEWTRFTTTSDRDRTDAGLDLISSVADHSNLILDRSLDRYYLSHVTAVGLPSLMAATYRRQAERVSAAAPPVRQARAIAVRERLVTVAEEVDSALVKAIRNNRDPAAQGRLERERQALGLAVAAVARDADPSGARPTEHLLVVSDQAWRASRDELTLLLRAERDRLARDLVLALVVVAASVAAALVLAAVIRHGVTDRISALLAVMARLIDGETAVTVPHLEDRNETGRIAQTVQAFRDSLIERARLEEESVASARAKSEFLGNISHEIRTPLNGVVGVASALADSDLSPEQRAMVELICASGLTVERLLSDVLDISKIEGGGLQLEMAPFVLRQAVEDAVRSFAARAAEKGVALELDFGDGVDGVFEGDVVRLTQVLSNLVSNAIKFTDRGRVSVRVSVLSRDIGGRSCEMIAVVRDTGVGFDESATPNLFERFAQADTSISRRYGGSGLGLSISKAIIDMMGGTITVSSTPGAGSEFQIVAPLRRLSQPVGDQPAAPSLDGDDPLERPLRILLVEDHEVNRTVVELLLAPLGVELVMASDGLEGVRRFEERAFDLVLMDMQMPIMDGLAATRKIRAMERARGAARTPIIMLTANVAPEHQLASMAAGADAHLAKPINRERLWDAIVGPRAPVIEDSERPDGASLH